MHHHSVLIVSDGTGETAYRLLKAAMQQFRSDIVITRYANVREGQQITDVLQAAKRSHALVLHTFASPEFRRQLTEAALVDQVECIDVLGPLVDKLSGFFEKKPMSQPGALHQVDEEYFDRMEAINFAIRNDNGEGISELSQADIILVGVSRTSKTPLSIYLAQEGWRVANFPIVVGRKLPKAVYEVDQKKVVGLTIDPDRLAEARRVRVAQQGYESVSYADRESITEELQYAKAIFDQNPTWPVINVTGKSIEEVSQEVLDELIGRGRRL